MPLGYRRNDVQSIGAGLGAIATAKRPSRGDTSSRKLIPSLPPSRLFRLGLLNSFPGLESLQAVPVLSECVRFAVQSHILRVDKDRECRDVPQAPRGVGVQVGKEHVAVPGK